MARVELVKPRTTRQCSFFLLTGVGVEGKDSKNTFGVGEKDGLEGYITDLDKQIPGSRPIWEF